MKKPTHTEILKYAIESLESFNLQQGLISEEDIGNLYIIENSYGPLEILGEYCETFKSVSDSEFVDPNMHKILTDLHKDLMK
jgi:hypothetical protein